MDAPQGPEWVEDSIFYQIFPDRFHDGAQGNDVNTQAWGSTPNHVDRMGGDLQGVLQSFDYLRDLGINALYFNPIFASESYHGYDIRDYYRIDPRFGTEEIFRQLIEKAHGEGWHILLDGVFNHTGVKFKAFQDLLKEGEKSRYRNWYHVKKFPLSIENSKDTYETFRDTPTMPKLNHENPETRQYLMDVAAYWVRDFGIDGWRFDAPAEIEKSFWQELCRAVREACSEAYMVGELWHGPGPWVTNGLFDATTNFEWRGATYTYLAQNEITPTDFDNRLRSIRDSVPPKVTPRMLNFLSNHDADRLSTRCGDNPLIIGQCILFQMTYPGVPCLYYGDEIGIDGGQDPDNRRAFDWDKQDWDTGRRKFYKDLIRLRHKHTALRRGGYRTVLVNDQQRLFGYLREYDEEKILVVFNSSDTEQYTALTLPEDLGEAAFAPLLDTGVPHEQEGNTVCLKLPARGVALLKQT